MSKLYYTAPTDEIFQEVKQASIKVWNKYDDSFGYRTEKIESISKLKNVRGNFMYMVAMFDIHNQRELSSYLTDEAKKEIRDRMIDGGQPQEYIVF